MKTDELHGEYIVEVHPEPVGEWVPEEAMVQLSAAELALAEASGIQDVLKLRDMAAGMAVIFEAQNCKEEAQKAKVFQLRAERKAGAWLAANVDHKGGNPQLSQDARVLPEGITWAESSRWQLEASLPDERFDEWVDEHVSNGWEITAAGLRRLASGKVTGRDQRELLLYHLRRAAELAVPALGSGGRVMKAYIQDWLKEMTG